MANTRQRLIEGAIETIRLHGIAGVSARSIASTAEVNQALIFYHFTSVDELLAQACLEATEQRVAHYRQRLSSVERLSELLALGRELHATERELGNVTVLAQILAGAQANPKLAEATRGALRLWTAAIEDVLTRVLAGSPFGLVADPAQLAQAVSAGFIGLELMEASDPAAAEAGLAALEQLGTLVEIMDELGPVARRAMLAKLRAKR